METVVAVLKMHLFPRLPARSVCFVACVNTKVQWCCGYANCSITVSM